LEQSPYLSVLSEDRVAQKLHLMGRATKTPLTADVAREVCLRAGSKAMLKGSIASVGREYVIGLEAINCQNGDTLGSEQAEAVSRENVLRAVDEAATKLRRKLGESLASIEKYATPVMEATTSSLEALQAYSLGARTWLSDGEEASIPFFKKAIELDPQFAMAYLQLGDAYLGLSQVANATAALKMAHELRGRTALERERLYIDSSYYLAVTGELEKAIHVSQQWEHVYPNDDVPHTSLGMIYTTLGQHEKSLQERMAAVRLRPDSGFLYLNLAQTYLCLNQFAEARQALQRAKEQKLPNAAAVDLVYELAFVREDTKEMDRLLREETTQPGAEDMLLSLQADTEAYYGHLANARQYAQRASASAESDNDRELAAGYQIDQALHEAEFGYPGRARRLATAALAYHPGTTVQALAALALAMAGDPKRANDIITGLHRQFPLDTMLNSYWMPTIRAAIELDSGNPAQAVELLRAVTTYDLATPQTPTNAVLYPIYLRGTALLRLGQGEQAAAAFQKLIDHRGLTLNYPLGALAHLGLARAYGLEVQPILRNSDTGTRHRNDAAPVPEALQREIHEYNSFLTLWKDADRDIPLLKKAGTVYTSLCNKANVQGPIPQVMIGSNLSNFESSPLGHVR
jgi:eukaryotic-like serine/threonine-protein kinase